MPDICLTWGPAGPPTLRSTSFEGAPACRSGGRAVGQSVGQSVSRRVSAGWIDRSLGGSAGRIARWVCRSVGWLFGRPV